MSIPPKNSTTGKINNEINKKIKPNKLSKTKKTKQSMQLEIERLQTRLNDIEKVSNSYSETIGSFTESFVMDLYNKDIIKRIDNQKLQTWFSSPDENMDKITALLTYYYIIDGDIFQLYDLIFILPPLDYKITVLEKDEQSKEDLKIIKLFLDKKIRHKELTRDLAIQLASKGTLLGTWLGSRKSPYFYTFDNLEYIYPYGRYQGNMIGVIDLEWLNDMEDEERELIYNNLKPLVTQQKYERYTNERNADKQKELRYVTLPTDKSLIERVHTLSRNQRLGVPFGTQSLFDIQHKQKLKDLEIAIANKIIRALALLKFKGIDDNNLKVSEKDKKKVFAGVKKALEKNNKDNGISVIAIPDFSSMEFPQPVKDGDELFKPDKYESINNDITSGTGISSVLSNGIGGNYASANLNLSILYKRIDILLEKVSKIYNQLIDIVLGKRGENYIFEYVSSEPLKKETKVNILYKLQSEGYSIKSLIEEVGLNYEEYIEQSLYEIEDLKLREKIIPPKTSHTLSGSDDSGRPSGDDKEDNEGDNQSPSPSD